MASRRVVEDEVEVMAVECDEIWMYEVIDEVEDEYGAEELNVIDGIPARGEFTYSEGPVIVWVVE